MTVGTLLDRGQRRGVESRDVITGREAEVGIREDEEELSRTIKSKGDRQKGESKTKAKV